jgi:SEC-C motif-containing protein
LPENAEQLMRSRYTAHVLGNAAYLRDSWHPDSRPDRIDLDPKIRWIGLQVREHRGSATEARVEFEARLIVNGRVEALREDSEFVCAQGRWLYTRGQQLPPDFEPYKPGRNETCPCGSGRKFKRCCG